MSHMTHRVKRSLLPLVYPLRNLTRPRKFHAYAVGLPRTGTHSLAYIFERHYRSLHEPEKAYVGDLIYAYEIEKMSESALTDTFAKRDGVLWLEMEASHLMTPFVSVLARQFPEAKFILLLRDAYSWLYSTLNIHLPQAKPDGLRDAVRKPWIARYGFGRVPYQDGDQVLKERGLPPVAGYLSHWAEMYNRVLTHVPPERLLLLYTYEISSSLDKLASFLDVPIATLEPERSKSSVKESKNRLLFEIDRDYLDAQIDQHCRVLMDRYFPSIKKLEDAIKAT